MPTPPRLAPLAAIVLAIVSAVLLAAAAAAPTSGLSPRELRQATVGGNPNFYPRRIPPHLQSHYVPENATCHVAIEARRPLTVVAHKANFSDFVFDGELRGKKVWDEVDYTPDFVDIATNIRVPDRYRTRAKVRYTIDDDGADGWLVWGIELFDDKIYNQILHTCHCVNKSQNQVIFEGGNDIEIFVDAGGDSQGYKEFETNMNEATTNPGVGASWDLLLSRAYRYGGGENSTRIDPPSSYPFDMVPPTFSARHIWDGCVANDPASGPCSGWSIEIAQRISKLRVNTTRASQVPRPGVRGQYRFDLSRVEYQLNITGGKYVQAPSCLTCLPVGSPAADNWVLQPTGLWNDGKPGVPDIHVPALWAFLEFDDSSTSSSSSSSSSSSRKKNPEWPARYTAHELSRAQLRYVNSAGRYASSVHQLLPYADFPSVLLGARGGGGGTPCVKAIDIDVSADGKRFVGTIASLEVPGMSVTVNEFGFITALYPRGFENF